MDLRRDRALARAVLDHRVDQQALDEDEDHQRDERDQDVEGPDASAFGEPSDSGRNHPADAVGARTSAPNRAAGTAAASARRRCRVLGCGWATASAVYGRRRRKRPLTAREGGRPLLQERQHALLEVARGGRSLLERGLELELGVHAREQPSVELLLDARVRRGGPAARRAASSSTAPSNSSSAATRLIRPHSSACARRDPLAEHRDLGRAREADALREQQRRAAVRDQPDVDEREQEVGGLARHDQVAGQRQRAADPHRRAVHGRQHRLRQPPQAGDDRVVALAQRRPDVRMALRRGVEAGLQVGAGREAAARAGDDDGAHIVVGLRLADGGEQVESRTACPTRSSCPGG